MPETTDGLRHVEQRQAIDVDAQLGQVVRNQTGAEPRRRKTKHRIDIVQRAKHRSRRVDRPMRRSEALHPAALLVDQDRSLRITNRGPQFDNKLSDLSRSFNISFEEDKSPWALATDKLALGGAQFQSGDSRDEGPRAHGAD